MRNVVLRAIESSKPSAETAVGACLALAARGRALTGPSKDWLPPAFVIVGAQRCGTTSMYRYLKAHPHVVPALQKEVHFFDINYARGLEWYAAHFVPKSWAARRTRNLRSSIITGEASPYYMFHPCAMERLYATLPQAKIIVMLRDPVKRVLSHYAHARAKGFETADLPEALRLEGTRLAGEEQKIVTDGTYNSYAHQHFSYLARGYYLEQLQRIHRLYPADQVLIVNSDTLYRHPDAGFQEVLRFLGLPKVALPAYKRYNTYNSTPPDPATRAWLVQHFAPHNTALYAYLGRDLGWSR
jgi:hypothetical protein